MKEQKKKKEIKKEKADPGINKKQSDYQRDKTRKSDTIIPLKPNQKK